MDIINTKHKDAIASFVFNTVLHYVGMSWIIGKMNIWNMIWTNRIYIR